MDKLRKGSAEFGDYALQTYIKEVNKVAVLSRKEEDVLAKAMAEGDHDARNKLIAANLRFVLSIAKTYLNKGVSFLDLINEGNMGLVLACDKFDHNKGFRFISYAVWWIRQYIAKAFAEQVSLIRLPMNRALQHFRIKNFIRQNQLESTGIKIPSYKRIADSLNLKEKEIEVLMRATQQHVSIDAPIKSEKANKRTISISDMLLDKNQIPPEDVLENRQLSDTIYKILGHLNQKERQILEYRFGLNGQKTLSLSEIGIKFKVTKERIRQIEKRAINKLRQPKLSEELRFFLSS